jgi:hypothetical protein
MDRQNFIRAAMLFVANNRHSLVHPLTCTRTLQLAYCAEHAFPSRFAGRITALYHPKQVLCGGNFSLASVLLDEQMSAAPDVDVDLVHARGQEKEAEPIGRPGPSVMVVTRPNILMGRVM